MWFCPVGYHLWVAYAQRLLVLSTRVSLLQARAAAQLATLSGCTQPEGALYRQRSVLQRLRQFMLAARTAGFSQIAVIPSTSAANPHWLVSGELRTVRAS